MKTITIRINEIARNLLISISTATLVFILGFGIANAETNGKVRTEMHITNNGQVLVRGAKVTAVASSTITATVNFNSASPTFTFTVKTDGSTQFVNRNERAGSAADVTVGNTINFSGKLDPTASTLTVNAKVIKDLSVPTTTTVTIRGSITNVSTSTQTLIIKTNSGTTTVTISGNTELKIDGKTSSIGNIEAGDSVRIVGTVNIGTNVYTAERIVVSDDSDRDNGKREEIRADIRGYLKNLFNGIGPFKLKVN